MRRNKNKRNLTKLKLSNSTRACVSIVALVLFVVSSCFLYINIFEKKDSQVEKEIYDYKNDYKLDYKVKIKDNEFIEESSLPKDKTYVSDLIDSINANLKYDYTSSVNTKINYDYKIDAVIGASYTQNGEPYAIWEKTYNLKNVENQESNKNININDELIVDYQKYHREVKKFEQEMGMSVDAKLYLKLTVNTSTKINEKDVKNQYVSNFSITVGEKIAKVERKTIRFN